MPQYHLNSAVTSYYTWFTFDRDVPTVDPQGQSIGKNKPRFRTPRAIGGAWGAPESVDSYFDASSGTRFTILAAGRDLGVTSIMAVLAVLKTPASGTPTLSVAHQLSSTTYDVTTRYLSQVRSSSTGVVAPARDIRVSTSSSNEIIDTHAYEPVVGTVILGTVVMLCRVRTFSVTVWRESGIAIFCSTDDGVTYLKCFESPSEQLGKERLRSWSLQGWFAPWHNLASSSLPTEAILTFTDYRWASDVAANLPQGGRAYVMKFKQASSGLPYLPVDDGAGNARVGIFEVNAHAYLDSDHSYIPPGETAEVDQVNYTHIHACGVTEYGTSSTPGWQLIIGVGDNASSSMIRVIIQNTSDAAFWQPVYLGEPNWIVQRNYHGTIDTSVLAADGTTGTAAHRTPDANVGNQFVGCGPGPSPGTLLLGQDTIGESVFVFTPSNEASLTKTFQTTVAPVSSTFTASNMFHMRTDAPHKALRNVICDDYHSNTIRDYINFPNADSINYSSQSGAPGTWTQLPLGFPNATDSQPWCYTQDSCFVVGNYIYLVAQKSQAAHYATSSFSERVVRRQLPTVRTGQELLQIGPGGKQYAVSSPATYYQKGPGERKASRKDDGRFNTVPIPSGSTVVMPVQPPTMVDAVYRMARPLTLEPIESESYETQFCYLNPTKTGTAGTVFNPQQSRTLAVRMWLLNSSNASDSPQRTEGRSEASQFLIINFVGGSPASVPVGLFLSTSDWYCVTGTFVATVGHTDGGPTTIEEFSISPSHPFRKVSDKDVYDAQLLVDTDCYLAIGEFIVITATGNEHFGYPLPPSTASSGQTFEPERADIELTTTLPGNASFTVYLAGMTPEDSWEHTGDTPPTALVGASYPLATLMTSTESGALITISVEPYHNPPRLRFDVVWGSSSSTYYSDAGSPAFPLLFPRGRTVLFAICYNASDHSIRFHASVSGVRVPVIPTTTAVNLSGYTFTRVRFGNKASGTDRVVGSFQWCCVTADGGFAGDSTVDTAFRSLNFIPTADPFPE